VHAGGRIETLSAGATIAAYPDRQGGVIFQPSGWPRAGIYRLGPGIDEPELLVPSEPLANVDLHNVEVIDGHPTMVYARERIPCDPSECGNDEAFFAMEIDVVYADLVTGETRVDSAIGGWESIPASTSIGGRYVVHDWVDDADWGGYVMYDLERDRVAWPAELCGRDTWSCTTAALSPSGDHLFVVGDPCRAAQTTCEAELRIYDLTARTETIGAELEKGHPASIDVDSDRIVVTSASTTHVMDHEGTIVWEIDLGGFEASSTALWPVDPPGLEILDPSHGGTVDSRRYTFRGTTCPTCAVSVGGKYDASVTDDGTWTLELLLDPGQNSTTFVATDADTRLETSRRIRVRYEPPLTLRPDGLGSLDFDTAETTALRVLTSHLGPPTDDVVETSPFGLNGELGKGPPGCNTATGYACFDYIRFITWERAGLSVVLGDWTDAVTADGNWELAAAPPNLRAYTYWGGSAGPTLSTAAGITIGSSVEDLRRAYDDAIAFGNDIFCGGTTAAGQFSLAAGTGEPGWLRGGLTESPSSPESVVTFIEAGDASSC
jgi:hypothetical protein